MIDSMTVKIYCCSLLALTCIALTGFDDHEIFDRVKDEEADSAVENAVKLATSNL